MSSSLKSPAPIVAQLKATLKDLQIALDPVTAQSIESLKSKIEESSKQNGGKLQSAQMYVSLAYVILDLVWILLKVSGVDPKTHPVTNDLVRVQEYLKKVHTASKRHEQKQPGSAEMEENKPAPVDRAKVGRFLRHALGTPASGKKTVFAEDGTVSEVVEAGKSSEEGQAIESVEAENDETSEWKKATSKKAVRQAQKAEKALKKAASSITSNDKKRHKKT